MIRRIRRAPSNDREGAHDSIITVDIPGYERALILRVNDRGIYFRGERQHRELLLDWSDIGRAINRQWGWRAMLGRKVT